MFGYSKLRADILKNARQWFDSQLVITAEEREAFIQKHDLLPATWAYKRNVDAFSAESRDFIDIEIRLHKLSGLQDDDLATIPEEFRKSVKDKKWIENEITKLIKNRDKILKELTKSNKKVIEAKQIELVWYMKNENLTPALRSEMLQLHLLDQIKELANYNIPYNTNTVNKPGARQSLEMLKNTLKSLSNDESLENVKPIIKKITKQLNEASNALQKSLAKEFKVNTSALKYFEDLIRKPLKANSTAEFVQQRTQQIKAMITVLEKRSQLLSGKAYVENKQRLFLWQKLLSGVQNSEAKIIKPLAPNKIITDIPEVVLDRDQYVTNLQTAKASLNDPNLLASSKDKKFIDHLFSDLIANIKKPVNKTEDNATFQRPLSKDEWKKNISNAFKGSIIAAADPIAKTLNSFFENFLSNRDEYLSKSRNSSKLSSNDINDQARICYALFYAVTDKDENITNRDKLIEKLQFFLSNVTPHVKSTFGKARLGELNDSLKRMQAKKPNEALNALRNVTQDEESLSSPSTANRARSNSVFSHFGHFSKNLPPLSPEAKKPIQVPTKKNK